MKTASENRIEIYSYVETLLARAIKPEEHKTLKRLMQAYVHDRTSPLEETIRNQSARCKAMGATIYRTFNKRGVLTDELNFIKEALGITEELQVKPKYEKGGK